MKINEKDEWVCELCGKRELEGIFKIYIKNKEFHGCLDCRSKKEQL